mmetsp:Transcript_29144/g.21685  ORF Transcript_29144/g.21685 Transcript_29144/m.21685 type:complete len:142 (+) Transcript_29144:353-778(+)
MMTDDSLTYFGVSLFMGEPAQEVPDVVFDTGSSWLLVKGADCTECTGTKFDQSASDTFAYGDDEDMQLFFGSAAVEGVEGVDAVYLDQEKTFGVEDFHFMLVELEQGLGDLGGILGFSRNFDHISGSEPGPLYYWDMQSSS